MVILQVCAYAAQYGGNFIASLEALESDLNQKGHIIEYAFPETAKNHEWCINIQKRSKVYFLNLNRFSYQTYLQIRYAMKNADVVHSHFELYDMLVVLTKRKKQRIIWHLHDSFDENIDLLHRIINKIQYEIFSKKVLLVSPNEYYTDYVISLGFNRKNAKNINNCIDISRLHKDSDRQNICDFLVFGGFYYIKGLDILLDACRILVGNSIKFKLGIVGYDDTWHWIDENYYDLSEVIVRIRPNENVSDFYNGTRVFLSTSRRECFSYALIEALYMGIPTIASDIPGNKWCKKYSSVLSYQTDNSYELANLLQRCIEGDYWFEDADLINVSKLIQHEYSIEKWVNKIEEVYFG